MEHWKEFAAVLASIASAVGGFFAKRSSSQSQLYKDLWEAEKEDRQRLEDKLDAFYGEGRQLAAEREAENTALRREVDQLRGLLSSEGAPAHAKHPGKD